VRGVKTHRMPPNRATGAGLDASGVATAEIPGEMRETRRCAWGVVGKSRANAVSTRSASFTHGRQDRALVHSRRIYVITEAQEIAS
jgi:hypothetical protein